MSQPIRARFYVEVQPYRDRAGRVQPSRGARVLRMTQSIPALAAGNIAVAVDLDIPPEAFQPHAVGLVVKPSRSNSLTCVRRPVAEDRDAASEPEFTTTREELFQNLILNVPHGYVVTEGEYGPGRKYHLAVGDLMDAFWAYCDAKEAEANG